MVLKGATWSALAEELAFRSRSARDIDVYVAPSAAFELRRALLCLGFESDAVHARGAEHHLAAVVHRGVPVEIHTRVMSRSWALPEGDLLASTPTLTEELPALRRLSAEAFLVHGLVHSCSHIFALGLKTAWDTRALKLHFGIDWGRVLWFVSRMRHPRAFWTPLRLVAGAGCEIPEPVQAGRPRDQRQRRLDLIADKRMFLANERSHGLNVFGKHGLLLMVQDGWLARASHLARLVAASLSGGRREARAKARASRGRGGMAQAREALSIARRAWRAWQAQV